MSHSPSYMSHSALAEQPHSWVLPQVGWVLGQLALLEPRSAQPGDKVEISIQRWELSSHLLHTAPDHSRHSCLVCEGRARCTSHHSCHTQHQMCSSPLGRCTSSQDYRTLPSIWSSQCFHSILSYPGSLWCSQCSLANHTRGHQDIHRMCQS